MLLVHTLLRLDLLLVLPVQWVHIQMVVLLHALLVLRELIRQQQALHHAPVAQQEHTRALLVLHHVHPVLLVRTPRQGRLCVQTVPLEHMLEQREQLLVRLVL